MRLHGKIVLATGLALLLASAGQAQEQKQRRPQAGQFPGGRGMGFGGPGMLLRNEGVQKELKLEKEQVEKAEEALKGVMGKYQDQFAKLRDLGREEAREKMQEMMTSINTESMKALDSVLKPEQVARLKQIQLQQEGAQAFAKPEIQKALKLSDDQKEKVKLITEDYDKERRALFQPGGNVQGGFEKMGALRKETMERVQAVLTDEQRKAWKELTGEPFEVRFQFRRPNNNN